MSETTGQPRRRKASTRPNGQIRGMLAVKAGVEVRSALERASAATGLTMSALADAMLAEALAQRGYLTEQDMEVAA